MSTVADALSLQSLDPDPETPADVYRSDNSIYACVVTSAFSIVC